MEKPHNAGSNGAAPQIYDLKRGSLAHWAKPGILRIPALPGGRLSAIRSLQIP
jgi:hypothetical protein